MDLLGSAQSLRRFIRESPLRNDERRQLFSVCTICVRIEFDPAKDELNLRRRGLSFGLANEFDFETALVAVDDRHSYGETRYVALGQLGTRLHVLCFVEIEEGIRVISFRKANSREVRRYDKVQAAREHSR